MTLYWIMVLSMEGKKYTGGTAWHKQLAVRHSEPQSNPSQVGHHWNVFQSHQHCCVRVTGSVGTSSDLCIEWQSSLLVFSSYCCFYCLAKGSWWVRYAPCSSLGSGRTGFALFSPVEWSNTRLCCWTRSVVKVYEVAWVTLEMLQ